MSRHTAGPWRVSQRSNNMIDILHGDRQPGAITAALCRVQARQSWIAEAEANARLIAAAPDMLQALHSLLRHAERVNEVLGQECGVRFVDDGPLGMARAAIERATGEAQ